MVSLIWRGWNCILLAALLAGAAAAETTPPPTPRNPADDFSLSKDDLGRILNEVRKPIDPRKAAICPICLQPLYKHSEPGFVCAPPGRHVMEVKYQQAECPVCHAHFIGALRCNLNDEAGRDTDFCAHSVGRYCVQSSVWVCPECGYAALIAEFGFDPDGKLIAHAPVDSATQAFVREKLSEKTRARMLRIVGIAAAGDQPIPPDLLRFGGYVRQTEIPDWMKYENAIQIYAHLKAPHTLMATLYLEGAHACRREVYSEVSVPALNNSMQVTLGSAIVRINQLVQQEAMAVHRQRSDSILDPLKAETDPNILYEALTNIVHRGENPPPADPRNPRAAESALRTGDMYVAYIRLAGVLDRLGRIGEALKMMDKARGTLPENQTILVDNQENAQLTEYFGRQLKLMRDVVDERGECLKREQEYLFNAAKNNMAALRFKEINLRNPAALALPGTKEKDPGLTCYILGETLRRSDAASEAALWLDAACVFLEKQLATLDKAEQAQGLSKEELEAQRTRYSGLLATAQAQRMLFTSQEAPDKYVQTLVETALKDGGFPGLEVLKPVKQNLPPHSRSTAGKLPVIPDSSSPATPNVASKVQTREQLYKLYYEALIRYHDEKKKNPDTLGELVQAGYIAAADANLDEKGRQLICPETKVRIGYAREWTPGDKNAFILFPLKPGSAILFANGEIRTGAATRQ